MSLTTAAIINCEQKSKDYCVKDERNVWMIWPWMTLPLMLLFKSYSMTVGYSVLLTYVKCIFANCRHCGQRHSILLLETSLMIQSYDGETYLLKTTCNLPSAAWTIIIMEMLEHLNRIPLQTLLLWLLSSLLSSTTESQGNIPEPCSFPETLRTTEWPWKILSPGLNHNWS